MLHSKFYALLSTCSPSEVSGYHKFLRHMHPNRKDALQLLTYIRQVKDEPDAANKLELDFYCQEIYRKAIKNKRKTVLNILFDLHLFLKHYLLAERIKHNELESKSLWLSVLRERGLKEEFSRQALNYIGEYESGPKKSLIDYLNLMVIQHHYYYYFTNESAQDGFIQIKKSAEALELYNRAAKYRMLCEVTLLKEQLPPELELEGFLQTLRLEPIEIASDHPLLFLYQELGDLLNANDYDQFDRLTELIAQHAAQLSTKELNELVLLMNNCLSVLNRSKQSTDNMKRAHRLNKIELQHETYAMKGEMRLAHFLNIVTIACKANDPDWAIHFANKTQHLLPKSQRTEAVVLSNGIIQFEKKDYDGALQFLSTIHSRDIYIQYRVKMFLLICHFELQTIDVDLLDHCVYAELYIKRNLKPLKDAVTSSGLNFIRILKMLLRGTASKQKIMEQIQSSNPLVFREWLQEKAVLYKQL